MEQRENDIYIVPRIDRIYVQSTEQQIAALHLRAGSLRTKVLQLFDVANNIGKDEYLVGSTASHVTLQKQKEVAAQIHSIEADEDQILKAVQKLTAELHEHWATYAASQSRAFCDCIRQKLPKELRLLVFEALWELSHHEITDWNLQALTTMPKNPGALVESWSGRDTGHCLEERFVGLDLQQESQEAWWRMSVFEFKTSQLIPKFLSEDFWGAAVKDRMRRVIVDLSYREYHVLFPRELFKTTIKTTVAGTDLDSELEYLFTLSRVSKVALLIEKRDLRKVRATVERRQNGFLQAASQLFPGLEKLQKDGRCISVLVDRDLEIKVGDSAITTEGWRKQLCDGVEAFDNMQYAAKESHNNGRCWPLTPRSDFTIAEETIN